MTATVTTTSLPLAHAESTSSFQIIAPHPEYANAIRTASRSERASYVLNSLRSLLRDRRYYINVPGITTPRRNLWTRDGRDIPRTGIIRRGAPPLNYGIVQLLNIRHGEMAERVLARFMEYMESVGEIIIYRVNKLVYYHLIEGSPLDVAILPPFTVMMGFVAERQIEMSNPFDGRDRRCGTCRKCLVCKSRMPDMRSRHDAAFNRLASEPLPALPPTPMFQPLLFSPEPESSPLTPLHDHILEPMSPLSLHVVPQNTPSYIVYDDSFYALSPIPELE